MEILEEKSQLRTLMLIVFIGFIGTSVAYPILPPLFMHPAAYSIVNVHWSLSYRAIMLGITLALYPFAMFLGSPILGSLSDHLGRKKVLLISLIGAIIGYLITALAIKLNMLWLLMLGRFLTGLMEGNIAIARSMAIDLKSINRQKSLGRINAMSAFGYLFGPIIGGVFADQQLSAHFSFATPFLIATVIAFVAVVLTMTSLKKTAHQKNDLSISAFEQLNIVSRLKRLSKNSGLIHLLLVSTIFALGVDIFYEFGSVFLTVKWHMMPAQIAIYIVGLSLCLTIGSITLPAWLANKTSASRAIIIGMCISTVLFFMIPLPANQWLAFIPYSIIGFSLACASVNITTLIANASADHLHGEVMGTQLGLRMLGDAIICIASAGMLIASVNLPIFLSSVLCVVALVCFCWKRKYLSIEKIIRL